MFKRLSVFLPLFGALYLPAQQTVGLFQNDSLAQNGYTLFAPGNSRTTYLVDNCGHVVRTWQSANTPGMVAYLLEDGRLLRAARISGNYNGGGVGGRIELFSWDGNLLWGYNYATSAYHAHHDVEHLPNGNILLIAWEGHTRAEAIEAGRNPNLTPNSGVWFERIVELEPVGTNQANIVWEWHLIDHLVQDFDPSKANYGVVKDHPELLDANFGASAGGMGGQDWVHFNAIDYNPELDQIMISSRSLSEIYIIDHSTTTAEAAGHTGGNSGKGGDFLYRWGNPQAYDLGTAADQRLYGQHDAHWIEPDKPGAGKIMVFNNGQNRPGGSYSSVDVLVPPLDPVTKNYTLAANASYGPTAAEWTYVAPQPASFYSSNISGAQRQPNGNTLICEGASGHFFEVDPVGNMHWDYVNPVSGLNPVSQGSNPGQNSVFRAYRYTPDYPAFAGQDLTPGAPVELNPLPSTCQIYEGTVAVWENAAEQDFRLFPNPSVDVFTLTNPLKGNLHFQVIDIAGRVIHAGSATDAELQVDLSGAAPGVYFLKIFPEKRNQFTTIKMLKQ